MRGSYPADQNVWTSRAQISHASSSYQCKTFNKLLKTRNYIKGMGLTLDSLSERLEALELQVGTGKIWSTPEPADHIVEKTLVHELASLQEKVDRIFMENSELRSLPAIIKEYRKDSTREDSGEFGVAGFSEILENTIDKKDELNKYSTEKQELILIKYPDILECYNLLMEFLALDIPVLSSELSEQLTLKPLADRKTMCEDIARNFQLLVVKSIILLEEFTSMIRHQMAFSQNIDRRMQALSRKIASLERKRQSESRY